MLFWTPRHSVVYCAALVGTSSVWPCAVGVRLACGIVAVGALLAFAHPAAAQVIGGLRPTPISQSALGFLTRFDAHLTAARISGDGESQFKWDTDFGVDMDVFDLDMVRGNVFINVETMVGDERRAIDPNQSAYTFDLSVFTRLPRGELGTTFHHISRHLADRENPGAPSWNMLGLSYGDRVQFGTFEVEVIGRWLGMIESSEVDYEQEFTGYVRLLRPVSTRISVIGEVDGSLVLVNEAMFGRATQYGGRIEGGVRINGSAGAAELVIGRERRIDADVFSRTPIRWTRLAFRFVLD